MKQTGHVILIRLRDIDLSAADIKAGNLRYGMHAVNAQVKYITKNNKLREPRRYRHGR